MDSGPQVDLRTALEAAGFGDFLDSGRLVVLTDSPHKLVSVSREPLAVVLNYCHHTLWRHEDHQLKNAINELDGAMRQ